MLSLRSNLVTGPGMLFLFYIRYFKNSKGKETIILFDSIQHNKMWYKLMKCGINGKLFNVL